MNFRCTRRPNAPFVVALALLMSVSFARAQAPAIAWRVQLPGQYVPVDPVRAADGTLYVMDLLGELHAVDPGGHELWSLPDVGPQGLDIGPDGTLYAGNDFGVTAVNPDGSVQWTYPIDPIALVSYGPAVGPEGNIYFVGASVAPVGQVISLTPAGVLRWSTPLGIQPTTSFANPVFGLAPDGGHQFIFSAAGIRRVDCDTGAMDLVGGGSGMRLLTNLDGNIYHRGQGYDSAGNLLFSVLDIIEAASLDGTLYSKYGGSIRRLDPQDASVIWSFSDGMGTLDAAPLSPSPDDTLLLYGGNAPDYSSASLRGADTAGSFLWSLDLPVDDGRKSHMATQAIFTPDGSRAYFGSTSIFSGPTPNCYLYAVTLEAEGWSDLGGALAGTHGVPTQAGTGSLVVGAPVSLTLGGALENTVAYLVLGVDQLDAPFKGGVLVPDPAPPGAIFALPTGPAGTIGLAGTWPTGLPSGFSTYFQWWIVDPTGPFGFAASNGLSATTP